MKVSTLLGSLHDFARQFEIDLRVFLSLGVSVDALVGLRATGRVFLTIRFLAI